MGGEGIIYEIFMNVEGLRKTNKESRSAGLYH